ncbi:FRG domain-containing protein [uncultured Tolumonas sp.]|uniref:FRG domain-containing protein n=1 Tax=uncultured Tolumonas sp. TaxID=263765 RepID=UPI0029309017|nr:FRG domain-containing protein [uncultured Tolumonas sp.]
MSDIIKGNGWLSEPTGVVTATIKCESWTAFIDFLHDNQTLKLNNTYCFRGHASENWELKPTLKREFEKNKVVDTKAAEKDILNEFKKYCLGRRGHNPAHLDENEWWALGQHFGLKTPLLDWSESPYVAAFFAFNSDAHHTENITIWMLAKTINSFPELSKIKADYHIEFLRPYLDENARLINQRGLFVRTPDMMCINEWFLSLSKEHYIGLAKILIPASEKRYALDSLDKMNINHLTLFPDLTGSAEYANYQMIEQIKKNSTMITPTPTI